MVIKQIMVEKMISITSVNCNDKNADKLIVGQNDPQTGKELEFYDTAHLHYN